LLQRQQLEESIEEGEETQDDARTVSVGTGSSGALT
jgi:hypothetical protein